MLNGSGLAAMRPQNKSIEAAFGPEVVENGHVGIHVIDVVSVGRVLIFGPFFGGRNVPVKKWIFRFALIVHRVESNNVPKIEMRKFEKVGPKILLASQRQFDYLENMRCIFATAKASE